MASGQRKRSGSGRKKTPGRSGAGRNGRRTRQAKPIDSAIKNEAVLIGVFALAVFLFLCNFGIVGTAGNIISDVMFPPILPPSCCSWRWLSAFPTGEA